MICSLDVSCLVVIVFVENVIRRFGELFFVIWYYMWVFYLISKESRYRFGWVFSLIIWIFEISWVLIMVFVVNEIRREGFLMFEIWII